MKGLLAAVFMSFYSSWITYIVGKDLEKIGKISNTSLLLVDILQLIVSFSILMYID